MALRNLIITPHFRRLSRLIIFKKYCASTALSPEILIKKEMRLPPHREKQDQRNPFAKNFFLGKYDIEFAAFPQPQSDDRYKEFFEWLQPIENYMKTKVDMKEIDKSAKIPEEVIEDLKSLGIFRALIPDEYEGMGLNASERGKLVETLSLVPVMGAFLSKKIVAINYLTTFCSDEQKSRYLPRIANGDLSPTICITEDLEGSSDTVINSEIKLSDCGTYFILNGKKTFVVDAINSNSFIVICNYADTAVAQSISSLIVDKDSPGIIVGPPADTMGMRGLDLCEVQFKDVKVSKDNLIGKIGDTGNNFGRIFADNKQLIGAQAIGMMKKFLKCLVSYLKTDPNFNGTKFHSHEIQDVVGRICAATFAMESALYLTSGMMDNFYEQDCEMEECMVQNFCAEECIQNIYQGLQIVGVVGQLKEELLQQFLRDASSLLSSDGTIMNTKVFISMLGLQFTGRKIGNKVMKLRNPLFHPSYIVREIFKFTSRPALDIADNLHPSLKISAELLEYQIARLKESIETLAIAHGKEILERKIIHKRIADFATYVFVIAAILARTSRSYCLGMRDADKEVYLTQLYAYILQERIKIIIEQLKDSEWVNGDRIIREIADRIFEKDGYFLAHPLARNL